MWHKLSQKISMSASPALSMPTGADKAMKAQAETQAFADAMRNAVREKTGLTPVKPPVRLYNIYTGEFEAGSPGMQYLVVSYIWTPAKLPKYPRLEKRSAGPSNEDRENNTREYTTSDFDKVVRLACERKSIEGDWLVEVDSAFETKAAVFRCPTFENIKTSHQRPYFREVFRLLAVEAQLRKLKYVWMDSLCINQRDPADVAEQVPRMADYFRGAEACVVVSEMLRRGYSHHIAYLGADTLNAEYDPPWKLLSAVKAPVPDRPSRFTDPVRTVTSHMPWRLWDAVTTVSRHDTDDEREEEAFQRWMRSPDMDAASRDMVDRSDKSLKALWRRRRNRESDLTMEEAYRKEWGLEDEIAGWIVGYHEFRMWTFQETYLARALVHRGRNIRINTVAAITIANERLKELDDPTATAYEENYEVPITPSRLLYLRYMYCKIIHTRFPISFQTLSSGSSRKVTLTQRMRLTSQDLSTTLRRVLTSDIPNSPSFKVTASHSSQQAIETRRGLHHPAERSPDHCLKLVRQQQRNALFDQDRIYSVLGLFPHNVRFALPTRYDISLDAVFANLIYIRLFTGDFAALAVIEHTWREEHNIIDVPSWIPRRYGSMVYDSPTSMPGLRPPLGDYNFMYVEGNKLVITAPYLNIFQAGHETCKCFATFHSLGDIWIIPGAPKAWLKGDTAAADADGFNSQNVRDPRTRIRNENHLRTVKDVLPEAANESRAVMVNIGTGSSEHESGHHLAWLVLLSDDGRKTWRKIADLRTDDILHDKPAQEWVETFTIF